MHTFQFCSYPREAPGEHTYLPISQKNWGFSGENCHKLGYFCIRKIRVGEIFSKKKV